MFWYNYYHIVILLCFPRYTVALDWHTDRLQLILLPSWSSFHLGMTKCKGNQTSIRLTLTSLAPSSCGSMMSLFLAERGGICGTSDTLFLGVLGVLGVLCVASSSKASLLLFLLHSSSFSSFLLGVTGAVLIASSALLGSFRSVLLLSISTWKNNVSL